MRSGGPTELWHQSMIRSARVLATKAETSVIMVVHSSELDSENAADLTTHVSLSSALRAWRHGDRKDYLVMG